MFVEGLGEAVADLLEIEISECRRHLLRVKTVPQVPYLIALLFLDQWVPLLAIFRFIGGLVLNGTTDREFLIK